MTAILDITGREILDSRGNPTVEVDVRLEDGSFAAGGARRVPRPGRMRRWELARCGKRYGGKGVEKAVAAVIGEIFDVGGRIGAEDQIRIDRAMIALDGTANKARLGANAILGVSWRWPRRRRTRPICAYRYVGGPKANTLPVPMMNIINGGVHADTRSTFRNS